MIAPASQTAAVMATQGRATRMKSPAVQRSAVASAAARPMTCSTTCHQVRAVSTTSSTPTNASGGTVVMRLSRRSRSCTAPPVQVARRASVVTSISRA